MIPYEELVAALTQWRTRNGLPVGASDYLGEPAPAELTADFAPLTGDAGDDTAIAVEAVEELSDLDVAEEISVDGFEAGGEAADAPAWAGEDGYAAEAEYAGEAGDGGYADHGVEADGGDGGGFMEASDPAPLPEPDGQAAYPADAGEAAAPEAPADVEIDALHAEYGAGGHDQGFGADEETAYAPVQSDAEVEEHVLDYSGGDEEEATMIGEASQQQDAPAVEDGAEVGNDPFAGAEDAYAAAASEVERPAELADGTLDVDVEMGAGDIVSESDLPPPPPAGGYEDEATNIAGFDQAEPPPLAPPPDEHAVDEVDIETEAVDVLEESDAPDEEPPPQ